MKRVRHGFGREWVKRATACAAAALLAAAMTLLHRAGAEAEARDMLAEAWRARQEAIAADPVRQQEVTPGMMTVPYVDEDGIREQEMAVCTLQTEAGTMHYTAEVIGEPDANGLYPLYIALHGGGGGPAEGNNEQWIMMTGYYRETIASGIYVACRGMEDTWNTHFLDASYPMYDRLIEDMVALKNADPNRVYLLGFSAGGDGVYAIAPRMADRFAAVNMSSGHPNGVSLLNAANLPFEIQVGIRDYYSEEAMRSVRGAEFEGTLRAYHEKYGFGYPHRVLVHVPYGHNFNDSADPDGTDAVLTDPEAFARRAVDEDWLSMFLAVQEEACGAADVSSLSYAYGDDALDAPLRELITQGLGMETDSRVDTNAVAYVSGFVRDPHPERLVWDLSTRAKSRRDTGFYWLRADFSVDRGIIEASFDAETNTVTVRPEGVNGGFDILIQPGMMDLSRPLTVATPAGEWTCHPEADAETAARSLAETGDPELAWVAVISVGEDGKVQE